MFLIAGCLLNDMLQSHLFLLCEHPNAAISLFLCEHGNSAISLILMRTRQLSHLTNSYANTATQPSHLFLCEHRKCEHRNAAISHIYSFTNTATQPHWNLLEVPEKSEQFRTVVPNSSEQLANSSTAARKLPRALSKLFGTVRFFPGPPESLNSKLSRSFPQRPAEQQAASECYFLGLQPYFGLGFDTSDVGHKLLFEGSNPSSIFHWERPC
jgi:hypothetical protein